MDLEHEVNRFATEIKDVSNSPILSVVLYGSAASETFVPGKSDLNFLVVVEELDRRVLDGLQKAARSWKRRRVALPLVVDRHFLSSSTDSYPLEILGFKAAYRIVAGADPLADLAVEDENVRLQAERELKAKGLLLQQGYVDSAGRTRSLLKILGASATAITAILRGMLYLKGGSWKTAGPAFGKACEETLGVGPAVLESMWAVRSGRQRVDRAGAVGLYMRALDLVRGLSRQIEN